MDKKDEIILQQLDVIRTMTQNSLNRMGSDFWGAPPVQDTPKSTAPEKGAKPEKTAASTGADEKKEEEAPLPPSLILPARRRGVILISNKMLYLKSRVFHTLVPHVPCVTPSHKNLTRLAL